MKTCGACYGSGKVHCTACGGTGRKSRFTSYGGGGVEINSCAVCNGSGRKRCDFCNGTGKVEDTEFGDPPVPGLDTGLGGGIAVWNKIISPGLTCPECGKPAIPGGFKAWQIVVAILFFPMGLLALLAPRKPNHCTYCNYTWT